MSDKEERLRFKDVPSIELKGEEWLRFDDVVNAYAVEFPEAHISEIQEMLAESCAGGLPSIRLTTGELITHSEWGEWDDRQIDVADIGVSKDTIERIYADVDILSETMRERKEELARKDREEWEWNARGNRERYCRGETWLSFQWAATEIKRRHNLSLGIAQKTLRQLCADGDIRSLRYQPSTDHVGGVGGFIVPDENAVVGLIKPSEWRRDEVDFETDDDWATGRSVEVSLGDLQYWLDAQAKDAGKPAEKIETTKKTLTLKQTEIARAVAKAFPEGIEGLSNTQVARRVGDEIAASRKEKNLPKLDISDDTILREVGRRRKAS
jgi:hypothetical protein